MDDRVVLVVGSSGILHPAASALTAGGSTVVCVSRYRADESIAVDARDTGSLRAALDGRTWSDALVYRPAVSEESLAFLQSTTSGRCVVILTSEAADPVLGEVSVGADILLAGWTVSDRPRWHTAAEVSDAALEVLGDGAPRILGTVRPWCNRPR